MILVDVECVSSSRKLTVCLLWQCVQGLTGTGGKLTGMAEEWIPGPFAKKKQQQTGALGRRTLQDNKPLQHPQPSAECKLKWLWDHTSPQMEWPSSRKQMTINALEEIGKDGCCWLEHKLFQHPRKSEWIVLKMHLPWIKLSQSWG